MSELSAYRVTTKKPTEDWQLKALGEVRDELVRKGIGAVDRMKLAHLGGPIEVVTGDTTTCATCGRTEGIEVSYEEREQESGAIWYYITGDVLPIVHDGRTALCIPCAEVVGW